jgi:hypothetical protein
MRRTLATLIGLAVVGTMAGAACSSDRRAAETTTTSSTTATSAPTSTTAATLVGASTSPVSTPRAGHTKLTGLTVTNQGSFDRVTFTLRDGIPGYAVEYVGRPVLQDASGQPIEVAGDHVLQVTLSGASGVDLSGGKMTATYTGPTRIAGTTPAIAEIVRRGDFEDVLSWVIGTHGQPAFTVSTDPAAGTVVVDLAHP